MFGEDLKRAPSLQQRRYGPMVRPNVDARLIRAKGGVCKMISPLSQGSIALCINGESSLDPSMTPRERRRRQRRSKAVKMMAIA
jgi:hypothetical protein